MEAAEVVARVRRSNIEIAERANQSELSGVVPFICECGDPACRGLALLSLDAFELVRSQPSWTLLGDAHAARWRVVDTQERKTVKESRLND
jgi:hypothetical protein